MITYFFEKNSIFEQVNHTICESARVMFKNSDINSVLWLKVIKTAVFLKNHSSTQCLKNKTLYEAWTDKKLNLNRLHIFDTIAWTHIFKKHHQQKAKFKDRSLKCCYLNTVSNFIYCVWDSKFKRVLQVHNCFVNKSIKAYKNMTNLQIDSKRMFSVVSVISVVSFVSERVFTFTFMS